MCLYIWKEIHLCDKLSDKLKTLWIQWTPKLNIDPIEVQ